jgi:hypothetical protein
MLTLRRRHEKVSVPRQFCARRRRYRRRPRRPSVRSFARVFDACSTVGIGAAAAAPAVERSRRGCSALESRHGETRDGSRARARAVVAESRER